MLDAAREAISFAKNKNRSDLYSDRMLVLSIVKSIEIIGEAASTITKEFREKQKGIPWANIIAMRNRLIHVISDPELREDLIDIALIEKTKRIKGNSISAKEYFAKR